MYFIDHSNLATIFLDDEQLKIRKLLRQPVGRLNITSGSVVACDPLVQPDREAFSHQISNRNDYQVELIQRPDGINALAVLWLQQQDRVSVVDINWQLAVLANDEPQTLADNGFLGYTVDSGRGCFMDPEAAVALAERERRESQSPDFISYFDNVIDQEEAGQSFLNHYPLGEESHYNVIMFDAGYGDGVYPSYWGLDAMGNPVALVTDFLVIKNGDGRSDKEIKLAEYVAQLSAEKIGYLNDLTQAIDDNDLTKVQQLLADNKVSANDVIPSLGDTAIFEAIRQNNVELLALLLAGKPCLAMPEMCHTKSWQSYLDYANRLTKLRNPTILTLLQASNIDNTTKESGLWQKLTSLFKR